MELTYAEKLLKFTVGQYKFPVPPVSTSFWTNKNWIDYIDKHGVWS